MAPRARIRVPRPVVRHPAPGVRLHLLRTPRFTTTLCRVAFHTRIGPHATATALLSQVLQSTTERDTSRAALAERLANLYGASLHVGVEKLGERQLLAATLEWPTAHVPRAGTLLARGLSLLRDVIALPKRDPADPESLDPAIVHTERVNHQRALEALGNDKARYALRRCVAALCAEEAFGLDVEGRIEDLDAASPRALGRLHARLIRRAPVDIFLIGDLTLEQALRAVRTNLLWPRAATVAQAPRAASVRAARPRPRRVVEQQDVAQGKLVLGYRGAIRPRSKAAYAAEVLAGVLGGGAYSQLFKIVREQHGLCYYASAAWNRAKGLLILQSGVDRKDEPAARRLSQRLVRRVAGGALDAEALDGFLKSRRRWAESLGDSRPALLAWLQHADALGLDTDPDAYVAQLAAVTPAQVRRVGERLALDTTFYLEPRSSRESGS